MIQARVKDTYRFGRSLQAFSRLEFTKGEWRDVPAEFEAAARTHEHLEIRERPIIEAGAIETVAPVTVIGEPEAEVVPTAEQLLDKMLAESAEAESGTEEVKETRRGRGGKSRG